MEDPPSVASKIRCWLDTRFEANFIEKVAEMIRFRNQFDPRERPRRLDRDASEDFPPRQEHAAFRINNRRSEQMPRHPAPSGPGPPWPTESRLGSISQENAR